MWDSAKVAPQKWNKGQGHQGIEGLDRSLAPLLCPQRGQVSRYLAYPSSLLLLCERKLHISSIRAQYSRVCRATSMGLWVSTEVQISSVNLHLREEMFSLLFRIVSKIAVLNFLQKKHILALTIVSLSI